MKIWTFLSIIFFTLFFCTKKSENTNVSQNLLLGKWESNGSFTIKSIPGVFTFKDSSNVEVSDYYLDTKFKVSFNLDSTYILQNNSTNSIKGTFIHKNDSVFILRENKIWFKFKIDTLTYKKINLTIDWCKIQFHDSIETTIVHGKGIKFTLKKGEL